MAGEYLAVLQNDGTTAWIPTSLAGSFAQPPPPPPPPPPPGGATIFGFNTSDSTRNVKLGWWGKVPCGRGYYGYALLPTNGAGFLPGGKEYKLAGLDFPGIVSSKRVNVSARIHPTDVTSLSSPVVQNHFDYARTVPAGWTVYIGHHEYNKNLTIADGQAFINAFKILADKVHQANVLNAAEGKGKVIYVINAGGAGIATSTLTPAQYVPNASVMPNNAQFWSDAYDNPSGFPNGYKNYGTGYNDIGSKILNDVYDIASSLGYLNNSDGGTRGWGVGEFNSPRRVAPKLASLDSDNGWGPLSPADINGAGQAKAITDYCTFCLGQTDPTRPVPASVVLLWLQPGGANWNQDFSTAGAAKYDDWSDTASGTQGTVKGPHWQGWPINVDPSKPRAAYKAFIDISA